MGRGAGVTFRSLLLGAVGVAALCVWTPYNNYKVNATLVGGNQFPVLALFVLFALILLNAPLRRLNQRFAFTSAELVTIWIMLLVASGIPSSGMMRTFIPNIPAPHYYSNTTNEWERKIWGGMPDWLKMADTDAAKAFYTGYPRGQELVPWGAWIIPLLGWGAFALCFLVATFCVAGVLRRQWEENERFSFPLVALPLLLVEDPEPGHGLPPLFRRPLFWIGALLPTMLHTCNGMHRLYPSVPEFATNWNLMDFFPSPPWNQIGPFQAFLYPLVVGIGYLLPGEVGLSLWFFHLVFKGESLVAAIFNWDQPNSVSGFSQRLFHSLQAFGGAMALTTWCFWTARNHLRNVATAPEYRLLRWGLGLSFAGMALWEAIAGIPAPLIVLSLLLIILALVTVSWATCQAGILFMAMPFTMLDILAPTVGTASFSPSALYTLYRAEYTFIYNTREMLLPGLLNSFKAGSVAPIRRSPLLTALSVAVVVAIVVGAWACIRLPYVSGGGNSLTERWTYQTGPLIPLTFLGNAAALPYQASPYSLLHILGGFIVVGGLLGVRTALGTGLHPIGFLAASVHGVHTTWFSILLGWAAKSLLLRYGGMGLYRTALPLFLGLIIGDALNAALWIALGYLTGVGFNILPS